MIGKYEIEIYNKKVHYFLSIKRNITILQGNSATGKTELIRLINEYEMNGVSSAITLISDVRCTVLTPVDWELRLSSMTNNIIFIDETASFLRTHRFAEMVKGSDNYFVIVTRDDLSQLPYSIDEIYGLRNNTEKQRYKTYRRIYNEMYKLYHFEGDINYSPELVLTEDSNSGSEYYNMVFKDICFSANGKSNIYSLIRKNCEKNVLAIVDGAAFGNEIGKVMRYVESNNIHCAIYAPESFEYLILASGIIDVPKSVTEKTYLHADSRFHMSWEEFYTYYLAEVTRNTIYQYSKTKLNDSYKTAGNIETITAMLPEEIKRYTKEIPYVVNVP